MSLRRRRRVQLPGIATGGDDFTVIAAVQPRVLDDHQLGQQCAGAGAGEIEQCGRVGRRHAVKPGEVPLELLLVLPALAAIVAAQIQHRVERHCVLGPVGQLGTHRPVADRHVRADAIEHAVFRILPLLRHGEGVRVQQTHRQRWQLVVVAHHVQADVQVAVLWLPA
ncbi:hypothetical protein D3C80_1150090 [compost metagenome]